MSSKQEVLRELRQRLRQQPARPRQAAVVARSQAAELPDDADLFRQADADARILRPSLQAEIERPKPAPVPRPREREAKAAEPPGHKKHEDWIPSAWMAEEPDAKPLSEEARLLASLLSGVRPIENRRVEIEQPKPQPLPIQRERDEQAALAESIYAPTSLELRLEGGDELAYLANGVPKNVLRDLRRGRWVVQHEIDLHGCNRDEARELLALSMAQWRKTGVRCVRVVHGKGRGSPGREPVLKRLVAGWLMNYEQVTAYCQARLPDGGAGALIVLLKLQRAAGK